MKFWICVLALAGGSLDVSVAQAHAVSPVSVEIVAPDGHVFRAFPVNTRDGALRSYLEADKGARYQVRVHNTTGQRIGLVIAVDGRNIINGKRSRLARTEPMYVLDGWDTEDFAGWRASMEAINEFYFTEWKNSYAEAFGDDSARGVIAVAVYREVAPPAPVYQPEDQRDRAVDARPEPAPPSTARNAGKSQSTERRDESAGTGYGDRRVDRVVQVEFVAQSSADVKHFIKYEWHDTLCRKRVLDCGEDNRFWDENTLGFAPPPPRRY